MKVEVADSDEQIVACLPVMQHLRELDGTDAFLRSVRSQQRGGYRLAFIAEAEQPVCVAGFRFGENLAWGRYLYVDDLVSLPDERSRGFGAAMLAWLSELARSEGAAELHLDSGSQRKAAHRFYQREGLDLTGFHFRRVL